MPFFGKRSLEISIISLLTSLPLFIIMRLEFLSDVSIADFVLTHLFAALFVVMGILLLRRHLMMIRSLKKYFAVNLLLWALWTAIAFLCLYLFDNTYYLWLFAPAKAYEFYNLTPIASLSVYSIVFLAEIILSPAEMYRIMPWNKGEIDNYL